MNKDYRTELIIQEHLQRDERILWCDQPDPNVNFVPMDIFLIPFSLLWEGFAIFWETTVLIMIPRGAPGGVDIVFPLFGSIFVIVGLYFIIGRFIFKKWKKRRTYYAVTNKRALIVEKVWGENLREISIKSLSEIGKRINSKGIGTLTFGGSQWNLLMGAGFYANTGLDVFPFGQPMAFVDIKDASEVYKLVNEVKNHQD